MVDGCRSKLVNVVSGVPQGSVLGPLLFLLYTSEHFSILENKLIGYADDSTLMAVVLIVDPWQSSICCRRSGLTRCTLLMVLYLDRCTGAGYTRCSGRTSVHLCTASLQNLAVQQDFYFPLGVPLERSG